MTVKSAYADYHLDYIRSLIQAGGPEPDDYDDLNAWIEELRIRRQTGDVQDEELAILVKCLDPISRSNQCKALLSTSLMGM
jgi:hypothetical protein